jgi:nicotinamidase-related amidase
MKFTFNLRRQALIMDVRGHSQWETNITQRATPTAQTAIIICDMWDNHWSRGAVERVNAMIPRMNSTLKQARKLGAHIIHAPSDVIDFYTDHPARQRITALSPVTPPEPLEHDNPSLPIDDQDGGSDTGEIESYRAWTRQHPGLDIDPERDVISDKGAEIYTYLRQHDIQQVAIMGVHTNMCVLNRSFAIKQMVRWRVPIALVRDLTDTMYNPARSPYVSHDEGTQLVISYIEKFWCPSIISSDLMTARRE